MDGRGRARGTTPRRAPREVPYAFGVALLLAALLISGPWIAPSAGRGGTTGLPHGSGSATSRTATAVPSPPTTVSPRTPEAPDQLGPTERSLILFNNTLVRGVGNATNFVGATNAFRGPSGGFVFLDSQSSETLEEVDAASSTALWSLAIPAGDSASAYEPSNGTVYVAGGISGNVTVVDPSSRSIVASYQPEGPTGNDFSDAEFDPALSSVLVTNYNTDQLLFYDPVSNTITATANVGSNPWSAAIDPANGDILVMNSGSYNVTVVSGATHLPIANLKVGTTPERAAYDPALGEMAVANTGSDNVTLIDANSWTVVGQVAVGKNPAAIAFDPDTGDFAVSNWRSNNVSLLDPATLRSVGQVRTTLQPYGTAYVPTGGLTDLVVASYQTNNLTLLNGTSFASTGSIPLGSNPADTVMDTDNNYLYFVSSEPGDVVVVNPVTFLETAWIPVGANPTAIAFDPVLNELFVADSGYATAGFAGNLTVIDGATNTVVATVPTPAQPDDVAYDPTNQEVYVSEGGAPTSTPSPFGFNVSVLYPSNLTFIKNITVNVGVCSEPDGLAYDPAANVMLVGCERGTGFVVLNPTSNTYAQFVEIGGATGNEQYDPFDHDLFVTDINLGQISELNATTFVGVGTISTGTGVPTDVDVDLDNGIVAVGVEAANQLYLIANGSLVAAVTVGHAPDAVGYDATQGVFIVGCGLGGTFAEVPILQVDFFRANPATITLGNSTHLVVSVADGAVTPTLTYTYFKLPPGCFNQNTSALPCGPTIAGPYTVEVEVMDHYKKWAFANASFTVNPAPILGPFTYTPDPTGIGVATSLTVSASLGTPPYTYVYTGLPPGCTTASTDTLTCTPTASGTFTVVVALTDADSVTVTKALDLNVTADPVVTAFTATPAEVVEGTTSILTVAAAGGDPLLTYSFTGLPEGCFSKDIASLSCAPATGEPPATTTVAVSVTDALGHTATDSLSMSTVVPLSITSFSASPSPVDEQQTTTLSVAIHGGAQGPSYTYVGLPSGCVSSNSSDLSCIPTSSGTFEVEVEVSDTLGERAVAWLNLTVTPVANSGFGTLLLLGIAGLVVVVAAVGLFVLLGKRRREKEKGTPPPEYSGSEPGTYPSPAPYPGPEWPGGGEVPPGPPGIPPGPAPPYGGQG